MSSHWPRSAPRLAAAGIPGRSAGPKVVSSAHPASAVPAAEMTSNNEVVEVAVRITCSPDRKVVAGLLSPPYSQYASETRHPPLFIGPASPPGPNRMALHGHSKSWPPRDAGSHRLWI